MRLRIVAIGRLRPSPEKDLIKDYLSRFNRTGRPLGLGPIEVLELEDKKGGGKSAEGALLLKALPATAKVIVLDERGQLHTSTQFSERLASFRDMSPSELIFVIGGADGLSENLLQRADEKLSFGRMVWPHMLVRVMLAEQLYRAASIMAGGPYHRI
ncbi:MAG: 23S rRNA (pseudouridine(1915)-N(3))-methyltransferase RlmH, partial [Planktomarina sp.]|jgi:23S rRNA (pseudouridine1915-N3)-methyltransferase|nr:23S rRNA (pseudouridine(1915)-N(3))-methyltransferase RlmH [Planktomarina sp.]MDC1248916.1 23S rRNA (pseudouridine(1915)-N(3))-methyltransferase RlmH [Planktomarina sp.]MDS9932407.1 23S rRNA (pseudouridine(1915)-N(3))-methyltransferase RlmH [Planktomarina sp.]|tara:strand:- start:1177 stop:1647 length:471 start_codon:yes stop_codon:yes gene_type:complete